MESQAINAPINREVIYFPGADGTPIEAWLYRPTTSTRAPAVVMAHGIGGVKTAGLAPFAEAFSSAGYIALVFDYRHWGGSGGQPREMLSISSQLDDYRSALAHVRTIDGVDHDRVFAWGTSFAGMHILELAASETNLAGAIAQSPLVDGLAGVANMPPLQGFRLTAKAVIDRLGDKLGRPPRYVPLLVGEGDFGVIATKDALAGQALLQPPDGENWPNRITARSLLNATFSRPVRRAKKARCPLLLVVAEADTMAPVRPALRAASKAPRGELYRSRGGHYDVYAGGRDFQNVLAVELAFLARHSAPVSSGVPG